jgi:hypothetical protein
LSGCWAAHHLGWILILNSSGGVEVFEVGQDYYGQDYYIIIVQDTLLLQYYWTSVHCLMLLHICPISDFMDLLVKQGV